MLLPVRRLAELAVYKIASKPTCSTSMRCAVYCLSAIGPKDHPAHIPLGADRIIVRTPEELRAIAFIRLVRKQLAIT